jgi:hypothetical protein
MTNWIKRSITLSPGSDGKIDSKYPDGVITPVDPPPPNVTPLSWNTIPSITRTAGAGSFNLNIRSYLVGTGSATAAITLDPNSTLPSGWSFNGNTLSYNGNGIGYSSIRFWANSVVRSDPMAISGISSTPIPDGDIIKWNPGHYVMHQLRNASSTYVQRFNNTYNQIKDEPYFQGMSLGVWWSVLEGPNRGDYSKGFKFFDDLLELLSKSGKRLSFNPTTISFGSRKPLECYPKYVVDNNFYVQAPEGKRWNGGKTLVAKLWLEEVMDAYIDMYCAYGERYNKHPLVEMFSGEETAAQLPTSDVPDFSRDGWVEQEKRLVRTAKKFLPNTMMRILYNYGPASYLDLADEVTGIAYGGPDPEVWRHYPDGTMEKLPAGTKWINEEIWYPGFDTTYQIQSTLIQGQSLFRGDPYDGVQKKDLRGIVPWIGEAQSSSLEFPISRGPRKARLQTPRQLWDYYEQQMKASHMVWLGYANRYPWGALKTGIIPYVRSIRGRAVNSNCPSSFNRRCGNL